MIGIDAPKQKPTAAHVASADKLLREKKLLIENREQHINILCARDAAQQYGLTMRPKGVGERLGVALKRYAELFRRLTDFGPGESREIIEGQTGTRGEEPTVRGYDEDTASELLWRARERFGIRQLAAEVEAGEEAKYLAEGRPFTRMESPYKREHGHWVKKQARTLPVQARG